MSAVAPDAACPKVHRCRPPVLEVGIENGERVARGADDLPRAAGPAQVRDAVANTSPPPSRSVRSAVGRRVGDREATAADDRRAARRRPARRRPAPRRSAARRAGEHAVIARQRQACPIPIGGENEHRPAERCAPLEPHPRGRRESGVDPSAQARPPGLARERQRHRERLDRPARARSLRRRPTRIGKRRAAPVGKEGAAVRPHAATITRTARSRARGASGRARAAKTIAISWSASRRRRFSAGSSRDRWNRRRRRAPASTRRSRRLGGSA